MFSSSSRTSGALYYYRAIVESSGDLIFLKDPQGRYLEINPAAASAIGKSAGDIIGKDDFFIFPPERATAVRQQEKMLLEKGGSETLEEVWPLSGGPRCFWTTKSVVRDANGNVAGLVCISRDITEKKLAEDALRRSEAQERARRAELATMMETTPAALFIAHDPLCRTMTGNRAVHEMLQVPRGSNISKSAPNDEAPRSFDVYRDGRKLSPDELPVQQAASSGKAVMDTELELVFVDGSAKTIFGSAMPLFDDSGVARGAIGAFVDVSSYKALQKEMGAARRTMETLLPTVAHEFREPLAAIAQCVQLLRMDSDRTQSSSYLDMVQRQLGHLTRLVEDLLDATRLQSGKLSIDKAPIDLVTVVNFALETCRKAHSRSHREFVSKYPNDPVFVQGDSVRLAQLFVNILNNAVKFSRKGGTISVRVEVTREAVTVRIRDDGIGIAKDMLPQVFDLYAQDGEGQGVSRGGLGLGLAIVRHIAHLHGGYVTAHSDGEDKGSEFVVELPLATNT